jgi:hypothetical protein
MATTTNYSWTTPNDSDPFKQGASAIRTLGSAVDTTLHTALGGAYPGLRRIVSQTVGTGVSSVTVPSCFSATYTNYRVIYTGGVGSASGFTLLARGSAGTGSNVLYSGDYVDITGARVGLGATTTGIAVSLVGTSDMAVAFDVTTPFTSTTTGFLSNSFAVSPGGAWCTRTTGLDTQALSSTGLTITPGSGTITGGTITVYGYGIS